MRRLGLRAAHRVASAGAPRLARRLAHSAPAPAEAAEGTSILRDHILPLGLWTAVSANVGALFSQGDEGVQVLIHADEFTAALLDPSLSRSKLTERIERISRGSSQNDSLKLVLLRAPGVIDKLIELVSVGAPNAGVAARNHAVKIIENISASPDAQLEIVQRGLHRPIVEALRADATSLYMKKSLAATVCNLASAEQNVAALGAAGALSALHDEQELSPALRRQRVAVRMGRLGLALRGRLDANDPDLRADELPRGEIELIGKYAEAEAAAAADPLHEARATLVESGVLLYLHTAAGGAAWGLFESVRQRMSREALVRNVVRTSLVTCFVPILLVGGVVTAYNRLSRTTDTVDEKFKVRHVPTRKPRARPAARSWIEYRPPVWIRNARLAGALPQPSPPTYPAGVLRIVDGAVPGRPAPSLGRDVRAAVARRAHRRLRLVLRVDAVHGERPAQE